MKLISAEDLNQCDSGDILSQCGEKESLKSHHYSEDVLSQLKSVRDELKSIKNDIIAKIENNEEKITNIMVQIEKKNENGTKNEDIKIETNEKNKTNDFERIVIHEYLSVEKKTLVHSYAVNSVAFDHNGHLASSGIDWLRPTVTNIWNIQTGKLISTINFGCHSSFDKNGLLGLTSYRSNQVKICNLQTGEEKTMKTDGRRGYSHSAFDNKGHFATGSIDGHIDIWDVKTCTFLKTLIGHDSLWSPAVSIAFNKNGLLASGSDDQNIKIWNVDTGALLKTLSGHTQSVFAIAFNNNGILASGSNDRTIKIWNIETGTLLKTLLGHSGNVYSVAFNDNGLLASGSTDETIKIWNIETGGCLRTLHGHTGSIRSVAFDYDGNLASASDDKNVKIWEPIDREISTL